MAVRTTSQEPSLQFELLERMHRGYYQEVIEQIPPDTENPHLIMTLICAHSFRGNWLQAWTLWKVRNKLLTKTQILHCLFHLAVTATRSSKTKLSHSLLRTIKNIDPNTESAESAQALAFYFYFSGQFRRSLTLGKKSYLLAIKQNSVYLQILSMDLISHSLVQTGKVSEGLKFLADSIKLAESNHFSQIMTSIRYSRDSYELVIGRHDKNYQDIIDNIKSYLKIKDSYSHSHFALDQARLLLLQGKLNNAESLLNQCAPTIYANTNRRQEIHLLIRYMQLSLLRGNIQLCKQHLRSAQLCLQLVNDKTFEVRLLIMKYRILRAEESYPETSSLLLEIKKRFELAPFLLDVSYIDTEILDAIQNDDLEQTPLMKVILNFKKNRTESIFTLSKLGFYGLLIDQLYCLKSNSLHILPDSHLLLRNQEQIMITSQRISPLLSKVLDLIIKDRIVSKSLLIEIVWGYTYDPIRHDAIVYASMQNLRKVLGRYSYWIETSENGWQLNVDLQFTDLRTSGSNKTFTVQQTKASILTGPYHSDLNHRQTVALEEIPKIGFWTVPNYKKNFSISTMTAYRDLADLVAKKLFFTRGHGKLTTYHCLIA